MREGLNRRQLLAAGLALPVAQLAHAQPTCGALSPPQTEGPFFKAKSPNRVSLLETSNKGVRLVVTGRVLSPRCVPVAGALLDFWHADEAGEYDNRGYRYRGHQFADGAGRRSNKDSSPTPSRDDLLQRPRSWRSLTCAKTQI